MSRRAEIYGNSLYDLASESGLGLTVMSDLQLMESCFSAEPEYSKLLSSPVIDREERLSIIDEAWKGAVHPYTRNFLALLCDEGLVREFPDCVKAYRKRYKEDRGIIDVRITSAMPLSEENKARLKSAIENKTGKSVLPTFIVDESLIGGLRVDTDGMSYEASLSYHLEELRKLLSGY